MPRHSRALGGTLAGTLRYGENPHQRAGFYRTLDRRPGVGTRDCVGGKALSYNNIGDADAALDLVAEFDPAAEAAVAIIKHANPVRGRARARRRRRPTGAALRCDPVSAFGGIVALNRPLDGATAAEIVKTFTEAIIAPAADDEALAILAGQEEPAPAADRRAARSRARRGLAAGAASPGGFLVQDRDSATVDAMELEGRDPKRAPTPQESPTSRFAFRVVKHVKSNAIVFARDGATVGIGAGQMSRVDSVPHRRLEGRGGRRGRGRARAWRRARCWPPTPSFPSPDGVEAAAAAGATAVIQPGGSVRDAEVIAAADAAGLAMVFTGIRHFRH